MLHPRHAGLQRRHPAVPGLQFGGRGGEQDRQQHAAGTAHAAFDRRRQAVRQRRGRAGRQRVLLQRLLQRAGAGGEGAAGIAVASLRVECVQLRLCGDQRLRDPGQRRSALRIAHAVPERIAARQRRGEVHGRVRYAHARPAHGLHRRSQCGEHVGVGRRQGDREAVHVHRSHQRGRQRHQGDPLAADALQCQPGQHAQFLGGAAAQVVEQQHQRRVGAVARIGLRQQRIQYQRQRVLDRGRLHLARTRLVVNAQAQFRRAAAGVPARHGAAGQRHAQRQQAFGEGLAALRQLGQGYAFARQMADILVHQHRAGDAARLRGVGQGDVVGDQHAGHVDAFGARALGGQAEIEPVAGVVLDHQQHPGRVGAGADRGQHRFYPRRGEQVAGDGAAEHAGADEAGMRRFVAGAAAGQHRHLRRVARGLQHDAGAAGGVRAQQRLQRGDGVEHVVDDRARGGEELVHVDPSQAALVCRAR